MYMWGRRRNAREERMIPFKMYGRNTGISLSPADKKK
jgi:hypothetical protein